VDFHVEQMLRTHPHQRANNVGGVASCIVACLDCAAACSGCADACIAENDTQRLLRCIRLNQDCATVCRSTAEILSRSSQPDWAVLWTLVDACRVACRACAAECERHARHMHCRICADACRRVERACSDVVAGIRAP
jgi:hypothetical protein